MVLLSLKSCMIKEQPQLTLSLVKTGTGLFLPCFLHTGILSALQTQSKLALHDISHASPRVWLQVSDKKATLKDIAIRWVLSSVLLFPSPTSSQDWKLHEGKGIFCFQTHHTHTHILTTSTCRACDMFKQNLMIADLWYSLILGLVPMKLTSKRL